MQYSHGAIAGLTVPVGLSLVLALASPASAQQRYERVNLVSDIDGVALRTDPHLVNPWGVAFSPNGRFWISDNGTGVATVYNGAGQPFPLPPNSPLVVTIPPPAGGTQAAPTGQVFNNSSSFVIPATSSPSVFLFATEDGTISGWNSATGTNARILKDNSGNGAVYKGLAIGIGKNPPGPSLYATNFHDGVVEQYQQEPDLSFHLVRTFTDKDLNSTPCNPDPNLPACFAPFGIQNINGLLYITYAKQKLPDKKDDDGGPGKENNGFVDIFDTDGNLVKRFASQGKLNSPWGLALAPQNFGQFSRALLVGNFGDGHINAFKLDGTSLGQLHDQIGQTLAINGLWALVFRNDQQAGARNSLFFTAGIGDEGHGLFGVIRAREGQNKNDEHQDEYSENPNVMNY